MEQSSATDITSGAEPIAVALRLDDRRDTPGRARRLVDSTLSEHGLDLLSADAGTVVTELVTNALLHGSLPAELIIRVQADKSVRLEVFDSSQGLPLRARQDRNSMTGRGLALVGALSERWGVERRDVGKVVWAELHPDSVAEPPELNPDALLAAWPDLDELEEWEPQGEERYTVHLGDVPTGLLLAAKAHVDNLVREFSLAATGARQGSTAAVPPHLAEMIDAVVHRFAEPRESIKRQALAAAHRGDDHVRLELSLPLSAADAAEEYLRALDQADDYCRAARLLTLESPPQHRVFRRWYVEELVGQLRGVAAGAPRRPPETFEERLLLEIDALAIAERRAERTARLQSLSSALTSAATPEAVTHALLGEGVAALGASGGAVLLASHSSKLILPAAVGYGDRTLSQLRSESIDAELPAAHALRTREPVWMESREERDRRFPALAGMEPETISVCAVPLTVGGRCLGALRFSFNEPRLFDEDERAFITAMAAQTAQALDRSQLYAQRIQISERLQRSLLPPRLPTVPGVRVQAAYQPIGDGVDVGGDFYDVWPCGEGLWALAIGDASGTGPEAAAMTALVRHTLRALTLNDMALETVLHQLNRALRDTQADPEDHRFCTVLLGFLSVHQGSATIDLVSGGHPGPVLLRADGTVEEVELRGSLLGLVSPAEVDRATVTLGVGDELVLYTDGVTDTRHGQVFFDLTGLIGALTSARADGRDSVPAVVEAVRRHAGGRMSDDVALLSLRFTGMGAQAGSESGMGIEPT